MTRQIQPEGWPRPSGYSNGIAGSGEVLFVAGQIGWDENRRIVSEDFAQQAAQALRNVVAVVRAAGGDASSIARMTWYVTDKREYAAASAQVGALYREIMRGHYPTMTLVQVADLLEDGAKVEIEATALLR